jgi:hypothetical protein
VSILFVLGSEIAIDAATLYVLCIVFFATVIRSAFGFGEALIAVPLLAFWIPLRVAAPLAVLVSITVAGIVVVQDWSKIHLRPAGWLVLYSVFGIPFGLLLLLSSHQRIVKGALAVILVFWPHEDGAPARQPWLAVRQRILLRRARRSVRNERTAAGDLWGATAVDRTTLSRHVAGIFFAGELNWDGGLLACGTVDARSDPLVPIFVAGHDCGSVHRQSPESTDARRVFLPIPLCRASNDWRSSIGSGHYRPTVRKCQKSIGWR